MARINEKDLYKYHKIDTQFNDHYLNNAFNELIDLQDGKIEHQEIVMYNLMSCVVSTVASVREKEKKIKKLNKYIAYLHSQLKEAIVKEN